MSAAVRKDDPCRVSAVLRQRGHVGETHGHFYWYWNYHGRPGRIVTRTAVGMAARTGYRTDHCRQYCHYCAVDRLPHRCRDLWRAADHDRDHATGARIPAQILA